MGGLADLQTWFKLHGTYRGACARPGYNFMFLPSSSSCGAGGKRLQSNRFFLRCPFNIPHPVANRERRSAAPAVGLNGRQTEDQAWRVDPAGHVGDRAGRDRTRRRSRRPGAQEAPREAGGPARERLDHHPSTGGGVQTTSRNSLSLSTKNRWLRASGGLAKRAPSPLPLIRCQGLPSMHGTA